MLSGKNIPSIQEVFPEFYKDENEELAEELKDDLAINLYKEQMLDWAMAVNKRNRAKLEGENK